MTSVLTAVFPVAGLGTRFLPFTKSIPKEMAPILNKPLIQYAVEEAVKAGCTKLVFISSATKSSIMAHFAANGELERELSARGKTNLLETIQNIIPKNVECEFIIQEEQLGLGHAVLCAEEVVGNNPFCVILPDDFITDATESPTEQLVKAYQSCGLAQLSVMEVETSEISNYGVVKRGKGTNQVARLIEKPSQSEAPSNIASIGRYVFNPSIFAEIKNAGFGHGGEIQLADAIDQLAQQGKVEMVPLSGKRFDCGSNRGYMNAVLHLADRRKSQTSSELYAANGKCRRTGTL
ncbi:UTP--glucose-1-phosphate uridylyltransferase [Rhodobacteraceae bacterium nBUS_24]